MSARRFRRCDAARGVMAAAWLFVTGVSAWGAAPLGTAFTYQGQLKQQGAPLNDFADFHFTLWDDPGSGDPPAGGNQIGASIAIDNVAVVNGLLTVELDFGVGALDGQARWLEIAVRSPHDPRDAEPFTILGPRQKLTTAPVAAFALESAQWKNEGNAITNANEGFVGIGTSSPGAPLDVAGRIRSSGPDGGILQAYNPNNANANVSLSWLNDVARLRIGGNGAGANGGIDIQRIGDQSMLRIAGDGNVGIGTASPTRELHVRSSNASILLEATGGSSSYLRFVRGGVDADDTQNYIALGSSDGSLVTRVAGEDRMRILADGNVGIGTNSPEHRLHVESDTPRTLHVHNTATGGSAFAGSFQSDSTSGAAVAAAALATSGQTYGGVFENYSINGNGVLGYALSESGSGVGVYGRSLGPSGVGVFGQSHATAGFSYGVRGQSASTLGRGVLGQATASTGFTYGVNGQALSTDGVGVFGGAGASSGQCYGGLFVTESTSGRGVAGTVLATSGVNAAVLGATHNPQGYSGYFSGGRNYFEGRVGIGISNPGDKLQVEASSGESALRVRVDGATKLRVHSNGGVSVGGNFSSTVPDNGMRISGQVGIGREPLFQLHLSADAAAKPNSNTWTVTSDARLKKNVQTVEHSLDDLLALRGVTYQWIDPESQGSTDGIYTGFIAQEVEEVFPEWVGEDSDGFKNVTVTGFEGLVVEALRELREEKDAEIAQLRAVKEELAARLERLERAMGTLVAEAH